MTIGERTLLGDPYLNLDPGARGRAELESGARCGRCRASTSTRRSTSSTATGAATSSSIIDTVERATDVASVPGEQLNATVGELARTVAELRDLTDALRGQEDEIAGFVADTEHRARRARRARGRDPQRRRLRAGDARRARLQHRLARAGDPGAARRARRRRPRRCARAEPLLREARPLVEEVREAAPDLAPALADVGPLAADTVETVKDVSGLPSLRKLLRVVVLGGPAVPGLEASVRNLVPLLSLHRAAHARDRLVLLQLRRR